MRISEKFRLGILASVTVAVLVMATASPSAAVSMEYQLATLGYPDEGCFDTPLSNEYVKGCFVPLGDVLWVYDRKADGYSVALLWKLLDSDNVVQRMGICRNAHGEGDDAICDKDFPENGRLLVRYGRCDQTSYRNCQEFVHYRDMIPDWNGGVWMCMKPNGDMCPQRTYPAWEWA